MRINTNISAMTANNALQKAQDNLSNSIRRLSSGYKINTSADDPAGCAISEKMRMQIKGLDQADNNAADGESVLNTAEGALQELNAMLARMKELTVQAANGINADEERDAIQKEIDSINEEIDRITTQTEFNTQPLLNGNLGRRVYSNVAGVVSMSVSDNYTAGKYTVEITQDARQAVVTTQEKVNMKSTDKIAKDEAGTITINGYQVEISEGDSLETVMSKIMDGAEKASCTAFVVKDVANDTTDKTLVDYKKPDPNSAGNTITVPKGTGGNGTTYAGYAPSNIKDDTIDHILVFMTNEYGSDMSVSVTCTNQALATKLGIAKAYDPNDNKGITAQGKDVQADFAKDKNNKRIGYADSAVISTKGRTITVSDVNSRKMVFEVPGNAAGTQFNDNAGTANNNAKKEIEMEVTDVGTMSIHIGADEGQVIELDIPAVTSYTLGTDKINVMTELTATQAIAKVDEAVDKVNDVRSKIGAYSNRFEHTRNNLAVSTENAESALSTMMDTDMAEEMTTYTSLNVLTQAATSILSQANERPATVLQILQ